MKKILFIFCLIVLALITRLGWLSTIPNHLTQDEVAAGWNGYSIWKTGRDEWNQYLPLQFRSVGDYKSPVQIYLTALSVGLLGRTQMAIRLPIALFSLLSLVVVYFLGKQILTAKYQQWAWILALFWILSPWHIFFSRSGFESVIAVFWTLLIILGWLKFADRPSWRWVNLIVVSSLLSIVTYHAPKITTPLLNIFCVCLFYPQIRSFVKHFFVRKKYSLFNGVILGLACLWVLLHFYSSASLARGRMTILWNDFDYARALIPDLKTAGANIAKPILLLEFWYKRLLDYADPSFWTADGLCLTLPNTPGQGVIYGVEWLFLVVGLATFFRKDLVHKIFKKEYFPNFLILGILLIGFLPGSIANNAKHAQRTQAVLPAVYLIILLGLIQLTKLWTKYKKILIGLIVLGYGIGMVHFADYYLVHYPFELSEQRHYPWTQAAQAAIPIASDYKEVIIDPRFGTTGAYAVSVPHYYFLYYSNFDPATYQQGVGRDNGGIDFANFKFRHINWQSEKDHKGKLYIGSPWSFLLKDIPSQNIIWQQPFKNGTTGLIMVDGNF